MDKNDVKDTVMYIQENYNELTSKMNGYNKAILDKYLLKQALTYYYSILGNNFEYVKTNDVTANVLKSNDKLRSSTVASIKLYSDDTERLIGSSGLNLDVGTHAWITVTNLTMSNITIGNITVPPAQSATIGTWGNKTEHIGIWYNLEGIFEYPSTTKELTYLLTQNELSSLNAAIRTSSNDTWTELNNCSSFAARMWNVVAPYNVSAGIINNPKTLAQNMLELGATQIVPRTSNLAVYYNGNNPQLSQIFN